MERHEGFPIDGARATLVRDHLVQIEESGALGSGTRVGKLLRFLVEEGLAGDSHRLNAYTVGVDGLGRPESFDPANDSSLRVAMHTIRFTLSTYYAARPESPVVISIPRGSYSPQFAFSDASGDGVGLASRPGVQDASRGGFLRSNWRILLPILFVVLIGLIGGGLALWNRHAAQVAMCSEARPTLSVVVGKGSDQAKLRVSVEEYLGYYPILRTLEVEQSPPCGGVPHFVLTIRHLTEGAPATGDGDQYQIRLTDPAHEDLVWSKAYEAKANPYYPADAAMAARIAYDIGHSTGVVASNALSHGWDNKQAEAGFQCLTLAHRYFDKGSVSNFQPAYQCVERRWRTSRQADLVALFSALEFDVIETGGLTPAEEDRHTQAMHDALARAASLSANDKEVLVMKLRLARTSSPMDIGSLTATMGAIDKYLPMEPHALNQNAISASAFLGNFDQGYQYTLRGSLLSGGDPNIFDGEKYYYLVRKDWVRMGDFAERLASWEFVGEQILALCVARKTNKPAIEERARIILARKGLRTEEQIRDAISESFPPGRITSAVRDCLN